MKQPKRIRPVVRNAVRHVRELIHTAGLKPGERLPATAMLARQAEVSYVSMVKAIQELRREGVIRLVNNHTHVVGAAQETSPGTGGKNPVKTPSPSQKAGMTGGLALPWQRVADSIRQDIVNRVFHPGSALPSIKELEARYRISYRTLRKALRQLVSQGTLESLMGGGYAVPSFSPGRWRTRIVCLVRSIDSTTMTFGTNDEAAFRALEGLCEQARIKLDIHLVFVKDSVQIYRQRDTGRIRHEEQLRGLDDDSVLGFAYFIPWNPTRQDERAIEMLGSVGKPVAVLDESGADPLQPDAFSAKNIRILGVATSPRHAVAVAEHLLRLGHRRVAFITTDHRYSWSQRRLERMDSAYVNAGLGGGVIPFLAATDWDSQEKGALRCNFDALYRSYTTWKTHLAPPFRSDFDRSIEQMRGETCLRLESRTLLLPLLDKALNDSTITAWITATDSTASMALEVLKHKNVRVPKDLSVISFDDSPAALRNNLSSYNFNAPAVGASILGFLVGRKPYSNPESEVSGYIVDRGSTAIGRTKA